MSYEAAQAMHLRNPHQEFSPSPFRPLPLKVGYRRMTCNYAAVNQATSAVLWLPGPTSASQNLLHSLCSDLSHRLAQQSIASCLFTDPDWHYPMYVLDAVRVALDHLKKDGLSTVALVGHALGATLALWAAADEPLVHTVVSLSATCLGPGPAATLGPNRSLLLLHGEADAVTSPDNSRHLYALATDPKQLILLPAADHTFTNCLDELRLLLRGWLIGELAAANPMPSPPAVPAHTSI